MADDFLCDLLTKTESQITTYMEAISALGTSGVQSYMLDTGQDQQRVTRADVADLQRVLDSLLNRRDVLRVRCGLEDGGHVGRPGW